MIKIKNCWLNFKSHFAFFVLSKTGDENKNRKECILNILLLSLIIFAVIVNLIFLKKLIFKSENFNHGQINLLGADLVMLLFLNFILYFSNKKLKKSLRTISQSEKTLTLEKCFLEIKIKEKIKELESPQIKELAHFRQLAEFGRLSGGLFHELANPLTAINLNMEQISELCRRNQEWRKFSLNIERVIFAAKKMGIFLTSVRKQIAKQDEKSYFSLNKEIEEAIEILDFKARKKGVDLIFDAQKEYFLFNNQIKFHQLVANLISNAIDSYKQEPRNNKGVTISLNEERGKNEENKKIILSVQDKGCGLSEELKTKIFDDFFSTKSFANGTGLGLALVKSVVENNFQGSIEIKSQVGLGSNFIIKLPNEIIRD